MRKRSRPNPHASCTRHEYGVQLVLEFASPTSGSDATQIARRLIESLSIAASGAEMPEGLIDCRLRCHELKQSIQLLPAAGKDA